MAAKNFVFMMPTFGVILILFSVVVLVVPAGSWFHTQSGVSNSSRITQFFTWVDDVVLTPAQAQEIVSMGYTDVDVRNLLDEGWSMGIGVSGVAANRQLLSSYGIRTWVNARIQSGQSDNYASWFTSYMNKYQNTGLTGFVIDDFAYVYLHGFSMQNTASTIQSLASSNGYQVIFLGTADGYISGCHNYLLPQNIWNSITITNFDAIWNPKCTSQVSASRGNGLALYATLGAAVWLLDFNLNPYNAATMTQSVVNEIYGKAQVLGVTRMTDWAYIANTTSQCQTFGCGSGYNAYTSTIYYSPQKANLVAWLTQIHQVAASSVTTTTVVSSPTTTTVISSPTTTIQTVTTSSVVATVTSSGTSTFVSTISVGSSMSQVTVTQTTSSAVTTIIIVTSNTKPFQVPLPTNLTQWIAVGLFGFGIAFIGIGLLTTRLRKPF